MTWLAMTYDAVPNPRGIAIGRAALGRNDVGPNAQVFVAHAGALSENESGAAQSGSLENLSAMST
jgi:hypothetical protein